MHNSFNAGDVIDSALIHFVFGQSTYGFTADARIKRNTEGYMIIISKF